MSKVSTDPTYFINGQRSYGYYVENSIGTNVHIIPAEFVRFYNDESRYGWYSTNDDKFIDVTIVSVKPIIGCPEYHVIRNNTENIIFVSPAIVDTNTRYYFKQNNPLLVTQHGGKKSRRKQNTKKSRKGKSRKGKSRKGKSRKGKSRKCVKH